MNADLAESNVKKSERNDDIVRKYENEIVRLLQNNSD